MARILVADDEDDVRRLVARALRDRGHTVTEADDGGVAMECLTHANGAFDLILTDIKMPVMDGIALALAASRDFPHIRILMMTGYADQRERTHGLEAIVHDVISKPLTLDGLHRAVDGALKA
jgi:CheY-like chemotaxis protein